MWLFAKQQQKFPFGNVHGLVNFPAFICCCCCCFIICCSSDKRKFDFSDYNSSKIKKRKEKKMLNCVLWKLIPYSTVEKEFFNFCVIVCFVLVTFSLPNDLIVGNSSFGISNFCVQSLIELNDNVNDSFIFQSDPLRNEIFICIGITYIH